MNTESVAFVLCIEPNAIFEQAMLLCESIRTFAGRYRSAPVVAVAPRPGCGLDADARRRLARMHVDYVEQPLNRFCAGYGSANRVVAAAWAEAHLQSDWVVVLDSDTLFLAEPWLPPNADVAVRPVDSKLSATNGPDDPCEDYWQRLAALGGLSVDCLPWTHTTVCGERIRAAYNGGLLTVRRGARILSAWNELFARSVAAGLKPWRGRGANVFASTGFVGTDASEYWGSNQAAAALAIWSTTNRVIEYPESYNLPLHACVERPVFLARHRPLPLVHVHYHWLFTRGYYQQGLAALRTLAIPADQLEWLYDRLPFAALTDTPS